MSPITPEQARSYAARWRLVHEAELEQLRRTSLDTRLQQLSVLMTSQNLFSPDPRRESLIGEIRERWMQLHRALRR